VPTHRVFFFPPKIPHSCYCQFSPQAQQFHERQDGWADRGDSGPMFSTLFAAGRPVSPHALHTLATFPWSCF